MPKKISSGIIFPTVTGWPFTFLKINGRLPAISPQNAKFVGIGYVSKRNSNTLERITIASPAPAKIGTSSFILSLNSLFRWVIAWISLSYRPIATIMVPPLTPGMILAIPTTIPCNNFFNIS